MITSPEALAYWNGALLISDKIFKNLIMGIQLQIQNPPRPG